MNAGNGEFSYGGPRPGARPGPGFDSRSNLPNNGPMMRSSPGLPPTAESIQSRAARYDDEKRRIIDSCFSKKENDGALLESYITHVRITEDAMYPSSPPPPDSAPSNKKSRLILIAVRKSGRVRVHKARENPSGSFSIGKSWALDELTAIQIYAGPFPENEREAMEKQWAGDLGFTVTLGKPYYWHAPTAKEKDFFIASLLKIYKKYTGGNTPELTGFLPHQIDQLGSGQSSRTPSATVSQSPAPQLTAPPPIPVASSQRPRSPQMQRFPPAPSNSFDHQTPASRGDPRDGPPPMPEPLRSPARTDRRMPSRENMRRGPDAPFGGPGQREPAPYIPPMPRQGPTQNALAHQASQSSLGQSSVDSREQQGFPPPNRATRAPTNGPNPYQRPPTESSAANSEYLPTLAAVRGRLISSAQSSDRPTTSTSDATSTASRTPVQSDMPSIYANSPAPESLLPPDRKRPFLPIANTNGAQSNGPNSRSVTPATTPTPRAEETVPPIVPSQEPAKEHNNQAIPKGGYFNAVTMPDPPGAEPTETATRAPSTSAANNITEPSPITFEERTAEPEEMPSPDKKGEEHRPGLGPMLKKKNVADQFRKAAFAASAFKPRQGGGAARLKAMQEEGKRGNEPDGITGVVPAPIMRGMSSDSVTSSRPTTPATPGLPTPGLKEQPSTPLSGPQPPSVQLERTATEDSVVSQQSQHSNQSAKSKQLLDSPSVNDKEPQPVQEPARPSTPEKARSRSPQRRKRQRQEQDIAKYASSLGIDFRILDGRGADFNDLLTEFGWDGKLDTKRKVDDLEAEVRREIGRAQATGWLGHVEQQDTKVQELAEAFDRAIEECEELDGLFTLYSHELDTLASDIEYIEAQSQGLQVQTANQKLLQKELQGLLSTLRITSQDLQDLHYSPLDEPRGVASIEQALATLYRALITIDPNIRQNKQRREGQGNNADRSGLGVYADTELGQMRAVREKKDEYAEQSLAFIRRFCQHMNLRFKELEQIRDDDSSSRPKTSDSNNSLTTQRARQELWLYNGMMLFVREVNSYEWKTLIKSYEMNIRGSYQEQFRQVTKSSRSEARKPNGEEQEALFNYQEKDRSDESITSSAARKLTVKRGKTVKAVGLKPSFGSNRKDGKPDAWEIFQSVLEQQAKTVSEEQNFMVTFFHLSSQSNTDFTELVSSRAPEERRLPNLNQKIPFEPDKSISATVTDSISAIYSFWLSDLQSQLEWVLTTDQLQGVGVLCALEHTANIYDDTNQEFITTTIRTLHTRLAGLFHKFIDGQIRAIEETKVKLKKRKGIISFMRTFPVFTATVENMIPEHIVSSENLEVRFIVNDAYTKVLRAMWESLTFIAKDDPSQNTGAGHSTAPNTGDPEDKEALNYHILLIENMNHYIEEVETHHNLVLEEWKSRAESDMFTHLTQYTDAVIRRPLGKWLDFIESTEAMMKTADSYSGIAGKPSHSRSTCKKIIRAYDASEIRKGIDTLKKRVEKHFGDVDDPSTMSKSLIARVFDECNARYAHAHDRMKLIIDKVYDGSLEIDWKKEDVGAMFRR
ncbi:GTP-Rho binding exocyst subunit [Exophiala xenobiotica]|uniref:GTP-Rho binding exocyst subunit n=1 Tax=Lithohypha guttulata TaxID=1690604 RepID=A0ABR0KDG5_9EURO|nr:GTP-Rho binding exocyst subunit [Lithohypha guttulata]KAK5319894.1 GTP-Rho binding exocyst subunit [Exophiala xenobiotica]